MFYKEKLYLKRRVEKAYIILISIGFNIIIKKKEILPFIYIHMKEILCIKINIKQQKQKK